MFNVALCIVLLVILFFSWNIISFFFFPVFSKIGSNLEEYKISTLQSVSSGSQHDSLLNAKIIFYKNLNDKQKAVFLYRLKRFIAIKSFIGKQGIEITDEIKVLVSAAAIQLTFGLEKYKLEYFHTFIIYPDIYESPVTGAYHKGETQTSGIIILSWKSFLEGYSDNDDRLNLGLHELAHALDLSRIFDVTDESFFEYFKRFGQLAIVEIENVNEEEKPFLRKYAGENQREFFAVCAEHFFESPELFYKEMPQLYKYMCKLLKQNPLKNNEAASWQVSNFPSVDLTSINPDFSSVPVSKYRTSVILLSFSVLLALLLIDTQYFAVEFYLVIFLLLCIKAMIASHKKIEIIGGFLVITNLFFSDRKPVYLALENIISISFAEQQNFDQFTIMYLEKGDVQSLTETISTSDEEMQTLLSLLREQFILAG